MEGEDCEMCRNCKRDIPVQSYQMHTLHCARNITLCDICDEPIPKREFEEHKKECPINKEDDNDTTASNATNAISSSNAQPAASAIEPPNISSRSFGQKEKENIKPSKSQPNLYNGMNVDSQSASIPAPFTPSVGEKMFQPVDGMSLCTFCHLEFENDKLKSHEDYCGSRTEECPECHDYVMLKDWEKHQNMRLYHELAKKPSKQVFGYDDTRPWLPFTPPSGMNSPKKAEEYSRYSARKSSIGSLTTDLSRIKYDTGRRHSIFDSDSTRTDDITTSARQTNGRDNSKKDDTSELPISSEVSSRSKPKHSKSLVDMYTGKQPMSEDRFKTRQPGEDYRSSTAQNGYSEHKPLSNGYLTNGFHSESKDSMPDQHSIVSSNTYSNQEIRSGIQRRKDFLSKRSISYRPPEHSEDDSEDLDTSFQRRVQKSSTESCLSSRNGMRSDGSNDDSFSKYFTSLEEQTRILAEIESKKSTASLTSSSNRDLLSLPLPSLHPAPLTPNTTSHNNNEYNNIADQLAIDVEEQAKIMAEIERDRKVKECLNRNRSSSFSIPNSSLIRQEPNHTNINTSLMPAAINGDDTNHNDATRADEIDILSKYLPSYTSSLPKTDKMKGRKSMSLVDRYLNPLSNHEPNVEQSPDPDMPGLQTVPASTMLTDKNLIDFDELGPNSFYETLKTLKTPFSQPLSVNGVNTSTIAQNNVATESLISIEESEASCNRVQEIRDKYKKNNTKESSFGTLVDIESSSKPKTKEISTTSNYSIVDKHATSSKSESRTNEISTSSDFNVAEEFAISIDEQARILAEIEKEKEKKSSPLPTQALVKTKSKSNLKSSIKRSKSKGRNVTFDESASKVTSEDKPDDWNAVVSSTTKTFSSFNASNHEHTTSNEPPVRTERRKQSSSKSDSIHKSSRASRSSSSHDLNLYSDTNHTKPKRNREKSPPQLAQSSSNRMGRKTSISDYSSSSSTHTKVKERSSSLSMGGNREPPRRASSGQVNGDNREALRQLLCDLRKDAMDDDLENNDGTFFPCEFCGDPYPVEYLMRHQLACDLNPTPITEGSGFDYNQIMQRAARNIEESKTAAGS